MLYGPRPTQANARQLRRQLSLPEVLLWQRLRRAPAGLRFRRQHPAGPYVLDFFCALRRLAVEVDGSTHNHPERWQQDQARDAWLAGAGVAVLRLPAREILIDADAVADMVIRTALSRPEQRG